MGTGEGEQKVRDLLAFLAKIGAAERGNWDEEKRKEWVQPQKRWRLTNRVHQLFLEVAGDA